MRLLFSSKIIFLDSIFLLFGFSHNYTTGFITQLVKAITEKKMLWLTTCHHRKCHKKVIFNDHPIKRYIMHNQLLFDQHSLYLFEIVNSFLQTFKILNDSVLLIKVDYGQIHWELGNLSTYLIYSEGQISSTGPIS